MGYYEPWGSSFMFRLACQVANTVRHLAQTALLRQPDASPCCLTPCRIDSLRAVERMTHEEAYHSMDDGIQYPLSDGRILTSSKTWQDSRCSTSSGIDRISSLSRASHETSTFISVLYSPLMWPTRRKYSYTSRERYLLLSGNST